MNDNDATQKNDFYKRIRLKTFNEIYFKHLKLYKNKNIRNHQI